MPNIQIKANPANLLVFGVIALCVTDTSALSAQTVTPLQPSAQVPTFAGSQVKRLDQERKLRITKISEAIASNKPLDAKSCKSVIRSCRKHLGRGTNMPGTINFSVSYTLPYGGETGLAQDEARTKIFEMAATECERIGVHFKGECTVTTIEVRGNNSRGTTSFAATARYKVEKPPE